MEIVLYNYSIEDNGIQIISVAVFDNIFLLKHNFTYYKKHHFTICT